MATAAPAVHDEIDRVLTSSPAFGGGLHNVLDRMVEAASSTAARQRAVRIRRDVEAYLKDLDTARHELQQLAQRSRSEFDTLRTLNARLLARVGELGRETQEWRQEYEPDSDPNRPAFFSNARQAFRAFFHAR